MEKSIFIKEKNNKFGFVDLLETPLIDCEYEEVKEFKENVCWVKKGNEWFLIDKYNKKVNNQTFEKVLLFEKDFSLCFKKNKYFSIDNNTYKVYKTEFSIVDFSYQGYVIKQKNKAYFCDYTFKKLDESGYDSALAFCEDYAPVFDKKINKWGLINKKFELIIDYQYDEMNKVDSALIWVKKDNHPFFIDVKNNQYLTKLNTNIKMENHFNDGFIVIYKDNKIGCMNDFFEIFFLKKLQEIKPFDDGYAIFKKNDKYGIIKYNGKIIINPIYEQILWKDNNYYFAKRKGQYTYISLNNKKEVFKVPIKKF